MTTSDCNINIMMHNLSFRGISSTYCVISMKFRCSKCRSNLLCFPR